MKNDYLIPGRLNGWAEQWPILKRLLASEYGRILDAAYERLDPSILYTSETHGRGHIERTILYGALVCMNESVDPELACDVLGCCALHDIGRCDDRYDEQHGERSARKLAELGLEKCFRHPAEARAAIHAHAMPDSRMPEAPAIYGAKDTDVFFTLARCLKDADNLDRVRIFDFDSSHLRHESTKKMESLAYFVLNEFNYTPTVLCFGDSNTYGHNPVTWERYPTYMRYPNALQQLLGPGYEVIAEGRNGRTVSFTANDGPEAYESILCSHFPVDWLVFMIGTNDCTAQYSFTAAEIAAAMEKRIVMAREILLPIQGFEPKIILVAPRSLDDKVLRGKFGAVENEETIALSRELPALYEALAEKLGCRFVELEDTLELSPVDGLHLLAFGGPKIAKKVAGVITGNPVE